MALHTLNIPLFRQRFPAFANAVAYPDATLEMRWVMATGCIDAYDGCLLSGDPLELALQFMTAHLQFIADQIAAGQTSVIVAGAGVDKVRVDLHAPPTKTGWQWWLATSPYGQQLWALLTARSAGGFYFAGLPERAAFRKVAGTFRSR